MRYFGRIAYCGSRYAGWQNQPSDVSVQQTMEETLGVIFRESIKVVGCGRTDSGVHASTFYLHFEVPEIDSPGRVLRSLNALLPDDIYFGDLIPVSPDAHARFDAVKRTYRYYVTGIPDPFRREKVYFFPQMQFCDFDKLCKAAQLIGSHGEFYPFCKSGAEVNNYKCNVFSSRWIQKSEYVWVFEISANRFLRGMVRLIVGACINAGLGKFSIGEIESALYSQERLERPWSAPGHGLYLAEVEYPYIPESLTKMGGFFEPFGPLSEGI
jgi:tRNA pseudouridine38-40 synthase